MSSISDVHVLVVDDKAQMRLLLRCLLRAGGITTLSEAETARQAFDVMRATPIDLVIVDWMMQPIDGLTFTRMVRWDSDSPNPYVPLLMLTAHTELSRVAAARDAGVNGFIRKPVSARVLFDRVSNALTDTRRFIQTDDYLGPDRRFVQSAAYNGPLRRESDGVRAGDTVDLDDARWRA